MLSRGKIKLIQSLNRKKSRDDSGFFLAEGNKMVEEALRSGFRIESVVCTPEFRSLHPEFNSGLFEWIESDAETIRKASLLQNPQDALAIVYQPQPPLTEPDLPDDLCLVLDFIQDPGNMGTILRIADWFGISSVICSESTVDCYNPKVVQASMGAIFRIKPQYTNLEFLLQKARHSQVPVYGTFMDGNNIYAESLTKNGIIVLGNEGNGISDSISRLVNRRIAIPTFSTNANKAESLNVAIAASICCSEFRRR